MFLSARQAIALAILGISASIISLWFIVSGPPPEGAKGLQRLIQTFQEIKQVLVPSRGIPRNIPEGTTVGKKDDDGPAPSRPEDTDTPDSASNTLDIDRKLKQCDKHYRNNRLTLPEHDNAFTCYSGILARYPGNAKARTGMEKIEKRYDTLIREEIEKNQKGKAEAMISRLALVNEESIYLEELKRLFSSLKDTPINISRGDYIPVRPGCVSSQHHPLQIKNQTIGDICVESPYEIARYEVSVSDFRKFISSTNYRTTAEKSDIRDGRFVNKGCEIYKNGQIGLNANANWKAPGFGQTSHEPVVCISWNDALAYAKWRSGSGGFTYRLPTNTEWEYALLSGDSNFARMDAANICQHANLADQTLKDTQDKRVRVLGCRDGYAATAPVGRFRDMGSELFDMIGNVREWTLSGVSGEKITRGGGWADADQNLWRDRTLSMKKDSAVNYLGFRLVRLKREAK